jgi:formate dehydrogenase subunit delta
MSAEQVAGLVRMANQIATAFDTQGGDAAAQTAAHIRSFWAPSMRRRIMEHLAEGGAELSPTARSAVAKLT